MGDYVVPYHESVAMIALFYQLLQVEAIKTRLNGFNICSWPTFVQQKFRGCWANVGQRWNGVLKRLPYHSKYLRTKEMLYGC